MKREEVIRKLYEENKKFRELKDKHDELDKEIAKKEKHFPMTHELEMEIEKLKKEKLYYKDRMEFMIQEELKKSEG